MALYVEQFLDGLNGLPVDLRNNMHKMRELDEQCQRKLTELDKTLRVYVKAGKAVPKASRQQKYSAIEKLVQDAQGLSDDKVQLAAEAYNLVDKQIRKLDDYLERFQADLRRKYIGNLQAQTETDKSTRKSEKKVEKGKKRKSQAEETPKSQKKRKKLKFEDETSPTQSGSGREHLLPDMTGSEILKQLAGGDDVMNMPIDPNEPTYCLCQNVSYGEMIACDNAHCRVEWFHMNCVGLQNIPKGKWYCKTCDEDRKKRKKLAT